MVTHDSRERPGLPARRREAFYTKISDATVGDRLYACLCRKMVIVSGVYLRLLDQPTYNRIF